MKIIMIGSNLRVPGGITRVVKNYIEAGIEEKVDFEYFPTYYGGKNFENISYFIIQYLKIFIKLFLFKKQFDLAHIHMSYKGSFIRKKYIVNLLVKKKIPVILHMHGSQFKDFYNNSTAKKKNQICKTLNSVSIILALGEEWKSYYESICETKVISLNNAVFPKDISKNDSEKVYITTMGVLSKRKGTYDLLKVVLQLKDKINPKYKFLIAGNGEVEKVKNKIKELGLEKTVLIPGWISDQDKIDDIYRKTIVYVLPSYNEGMPMSILEAMSYGLPVITTDVGSIPSVLNEDNGFVIKPGDVEALSENLISLLNDAKAIEEIGERNSEKIKSKYNIFNSVDELTKLYKKTTDNYY